MENLIKTPLTTELEINGQRLSVSLLMTEGAFTVSVAQIAKAWREIKARADQSFGPPRYVLFMRPEHYSAMLPMRRRKLQPYIRKAVRRCSS